MRNVAVSAGKPLEATTAWTSMDERPTQLTTPCSRDVVAVTRCCSQHACTGKPTDSSRSMSMSVSTSRNTSTESTHAVTSWTGRVFAMPSSQCAWATFAANASKSSSSWWQTVMVTTVDACNCPTDHTAYLAEPDVVSEVHVLGAQQVVGHKRDGHALQAVGWRLFDNNGGGRPGFTIAGSSPPLP